jgi:hypothetical protein
MARADLLRCQWLAQQQHIGGLSDHPGEQRRHRNMAARLTRSAAQVLQRLKQLLSEGSSRLPADLQASTAGHASWCLGPGCRPPWQATGGAGTLQSDGGTDALVAQLSEQLKQAERAKEELQLVRTEMGDALQLYDARRGALQAELLATEARHDVAQAQRQVQSAQRHEGGAQAALGAIRTLLEQMGSSQPPCTAADALSRVVGIAATSAYNAPPVFATAERDLSGRVAVLRRALAAAQAQLARAVHILHDEVEVARAMAARVGESSSAGGALDGRGVDAGILPGGEDADMVSDGEDEDISSGSGDSECDSDV